MTSLWQSEFQQKTEFHSDSSGKEIFTKGYFPEMWVWLMESVRDIEGPRDQEQKEAIITPKHEGLRGINSDMGLCSIWNYKTGPLVKTCNSGGILRLPETVPKQGRSRDKIPAFYSSPPILLTRMGFTYPKKGCSVLQKSCLVFAQFNLMYRDGIFKYY